MKPWKDLDINNIPIDFFQDGTYLLYEEASSSQFMPTFEEKIKVIENIKNGMKYQYCLSPLEPIRMTEEEFHNIEFTITHLKKALKGHHIGVEHQRNAFSASLKGLEKILERTEVL